MDIAQSDIIVGSLVRYPLSTLRKLEQYIRLFTKQSLYYLQQQQGPADQQVH